MTITISNDSVSVFARGYAHTEEGRTGDASVIVWLEIAPHHLKLTGSIWATLINDHHVNIHT